MVIRVYCDYVNKRGLRPLLFISSPLLVKERGTKVEDSLRGEVNKNLDFSGY